MRRGSGFQVGADAPSGVRWLGRPDPGGDGVLLRGDRLALDQLLTAGDSAFFIWTLTGTDTGPGGTGNPVRVSGTEVWRIGESGLTASSQGYYDAAAYDQ